MNVRPIKIHGYAIEEMVNSQWLIGHGVYEVEFSEEYAKEIGRKFDWYLHTDSGYYHVYPESIGQYIGIDDVNGIEIYEGDEVRFDDSRGVVGKTIEGYVSFRDGSFVIESDLGTHCRWIDYEVQVIGKGFHV